MMLRKIGNKYANKNKAIQGELKAFGNHGVTYMDKIRLK